MVQKKRPPVIKWNPYNIGETRSQIMKEINQIVAQKEHRRKIGLESGALREFKGNSHWNLFLSIELAELLTKRLNNDIKNIFMQTSQGLNNTGTYLANISQQLKNAEYKLGNVTTVSNNNVVKIIRDEITKLNKTITGLIELQKKMKADTNKIQGDYENTSKMLKESIDENFQNILKELCDRNEATQVIITEDIHSLKDNVKEQFTEVKDLIRVNFSEINDQAINFNDVSIDSMDKISNLVTKIDTDLNNTKEQVTTFQEATNNRFDDQQNALINEFQEGIGGLMKQNLENYEELKELKTGQTKDITTRIDESTENLTTIIEATNEHLDKIFENTKEGIKNSETELKKELATEITDLRSILSTIRSDIELMKSVLTKIDTKVH